MMRRKVEDAIDLESGVLDAQEYKEAIREVVQDYIVRRSSFRMGAIRALNAFL